MKFVFRDKKIVDLLERLLALLGITILFPIFLIIAALILIFDEGSIFFSQKRVGLKGKVFRLYKFKTMKQNKEKILVTAMDDPRITPLGRILRKYKLDELPQLFNILIGDLSFVGYRPEVPKYVDIKNKMFVEVLNFKPGITSPVTLMFRNEERLIHECKTDKELFYKSFIIPYKLYYASKYNKERTFLSDFIVVLKTILTSIFPRLSSDIDQIELEKFMAEYKKY